MRTVRGTGKVLESLVKSGGAVVDEVTVGNGVGGRHVYLVCGDGVAVLGQVVRLIIRGKTVMLLVCEAVAHLCGVAQLIHIRKDARRVYERVVGRVFRILIPEKVAACLAVDIVRALDYFIYVEGTAEMHVEGVPFKSPVHVVVAAASDVAEFVGVFPVLNDPHQSGNASFHIAFVHHVRIGNAVVGSGFCVRRHNGEGSCVVDILVHPLVCDAAAHHAFFGRRVFFGFLFFWFFRLFLFRNIVDYLFHDGRFNLRFFFLFLTAAGQKKGGRQSDEK